MKQTFPARRGQTGFTLIELLIVIAIILILIAIALPNFLEAQIRAKVARASADMRSIRVAVEEYSVDWKGAYPTYNPNNAINPLYAVPWADRLIPITTPVKYLTPIPKDPFAHYTNVNTYAGNVDHPLFSCYLYNRGDTHVGYGAMTPKQKKAMEHVYLLLSAGPDINVEIASYWSLREVQQLMEYTTYAGGRYSPTNGTQSRGDIMEWGP